jgi:hypothetical protein
VRAQKMTQQLRYQWCHCTSGVPFGKRPPIPQAHIPQLVLQLSGAGGRDPDPLQLGVEIVNHNPSF